VAAFRAGAQLQWALVRARPDYWMTLALSPFMAVLFLAIVRDAGRDDLVSSAVLAPALYCLVHMSLTLSGDTIANDRWYGTLELALASPSSLVTTIAGRVSAVTVLASLGIVESWLVGKLLFDVDVTVHHPVMLVAAASVTLFAATTSALLIASACVLVRSASTFQLALSFPLLVLGGILVPVDLLPSWLRSVARVTPLSWSSDLLRDALQPAAVRDPLGRLAVVVGLGIAALGLAGRMMHSIVDRLRRAGTVGDA
jgi:ABC-2 type transport system permease protein